MELFIEKGFFSMLFRALTMLEADREVEVERVRCRL
jgi:hypothetical protein